uniref:Kunitz/Bovine pancreatic trypsin inhibitor domain protein n=1 Tax=Panagrellus redivivus TaxID=6233 RepID=A0A7E4ZR88_PANRE
MVISLRKGSEPLLACYSRRQGTMNVMESRRVMQRRPCYGFFSVLLISCLLILPDLTTAKLECDPSSDTKKADPDNPLSYLYCNLEGLFTKKSCPDGKRFNAERNECEPLEGHSRIAHDDPILSPQFQAPEDICGVGGIALTKLSSPVACNPSMDSCPDGYECTLYDRTGTSYCCQNPTQLRHANTEVTCANDQITFYEPLTGEARTCVLDSSGGSSSGASSACPVGFGCNLVGGTLTRCCGRDFGCPYNSAGFVNPHTGSYVSCTVGDEATCPEGFVCSYSGKFSGGVCCSDTSAAVNDACLGDTPLASPNPCSASDPCPNGYNCQNGRCCPAKGMCPTGSPLGGVTSCSVDNPCPNNYQCVSNNGQQYCCPAPEHVCNRPKDPGTACDFAQPAVIRYYFDESTGSCRSFRFSQCGGNANNFDTLEQCEGFCVTSQCPQGKPYRTGASNAACSPLTPATCPTGFSCMQPLFGLNHVCCSSEELSCRESVSAGTACFGSGVTVQRYHFNTETGSCEPFQFYGCHGSSNNFFTRQECEATCQLNIKGMCNGVSPLMDPNNQPQRCSPTNPCPAGNSCNLRGFCCPESENACTSPRSVGNVCSLYRPDTFWFYDTMAQECLPFTYNGCGGTTNRFTSKAACERICRDQMGECPKGMAIAEAYPGGGAQKCRLNLMTSCIAEGASCVLSSSNTPICCKSLAECPYNRQAYIIPGSDSHIACLPDDDTCPIGFECMQSSTVRNFFMCCSSEERNGFGAPFSSRKDGNPRGINTNTITRHRQASPGRCPSGLTSNGQRCVVNAIGGCPKGHICLGAGAHGVCCRGLPKCTVPRHKPYYFSGKQVLVCGDDQILCPDKTTCMESTIDGVEICCQPTNKFSALSSASNSIPRCRDQHIPYFELGSRDPMTCDETSAGNECPEDYECSRASDENYYCCPAWEKCPRGASPFLVAGTRKPMGCNILANNCPEGYACEGPKDRAVCCKAKASSAQCPGNRRPFLYARKPLVCPPGSNKCPDGYTCTGSSAGNIHLCCSNDEIRQDCPNGAAYGNPFTGQKVICNPAMNSCPTGYICRRSSSTADFVCCASDPLSNLERRFEGYCPPGQIPYLTVNSIEPPTCHMALSPCPTSAPYQCIYSAEKQNSYCCTPTSSAQLTVAFRSRGNVQLHPGMKQPEVTNNQPPVEEQIDLLSSATLPPALPGAPISGCPPQSQPLLNSETRTPHPCSTMSKCPEGFTCYSNYPDGRNAQCCTTMPSQAPVESQNDASPAKQEPIRACPAGFVKIGEVCKRMFYVGQPGCSSNEQCQSVSNNTYCEKGYCRCPENKLIHSGECVASCPEGYVHIAGRCHDLTTIVFMDSVEDRANGTIGGYCTETVVVEDQCLVENSYCNERSITCHCKPGFELKMDFENKDDKGACIKVEDSKYEDEGTPAADEGVPNEIELSKLPEFFIIEASADAAEIEGSGELTELLFSDPASFLQIVDA